MFRRVLADGLVVALSVALLWHFGNIWLYGRYLIGEPNLWIRSGETLLLFGTLFFGVYMLADSLRRN